MSRGIRISEPSAEMQMKIIRARKAIAQQKPRSLRCPSFPPGPRFAGLPWEPYFPLSLVRPRCNRYSFQSLPWAGARADTV